MKVRELIQCLMTQNMSATVYLGNDRESVGLPEIDQRDFEVAFENNQHSVYLPIPAYCELTRKEE